jgi:hypothetical protein
MDDISFELDTDFDTNGHQFHREEGWLGGAFFEVPYYLSCLSRINYCRTPRETWREATRQFIAEHLPESEWIDRSTYFETFAVLLLKHLYRNSTLHLRHPIRKELRTEWVARIAIANPKLPIEKLAKLLKTTVKQIERNSDAMLARREYARLDPET